MTNIELQELLKQYPDNADINIHVDGQTSEQILIRAHIDYVASDRLIVLVMFGKNP